MLGFGSAGSGVLPSIMVMDDAGVRDLLGIEGTGHESGICELNGRAGIGVDAELSSCNGK